MYGFVLTILAILLCNWWVVYQTRDTNYFSIKNLPSNDVALVLGTSKSLPSGKENLFFKYRMEAAARLYLEGKVKYLILSGNNDSEYYNEPNDMKRYLLRMGIPSEAMMLDYAGFRTYDSILRCKEIFKQERFTIVSQGFHNSRALFLAKEYKLNAVAFAAQDAPQNYSFKTLVREYLARPRALLDVYLLNPQTNPYNREIKSSRSKASM
ncbi:MAG: ElyC/SanA/YdcF family protein [Spirosomataceae bacterium]